MKVEVCKFDVPTRTKRIYSRALLQREADRMQESIRSRSCIGTLGVPDSGTIQFRDASHIITAMHFEDGALMAEIEILNTPAGRVLKSMIDSKVAVVFRPFGIGNGQVN
jgi:hypothetical protein